MNFSTGPELAAAIAHSSAAIIQSATYHESGKHLFVADEKHSVSTIQCLEQPHTPKPALKCERDGGLSQIVST